MDPKNIFLKLKPYNEFSIQTMNLSLESIQHLYDLGIKTNTSLVFVKFSPLKKSVILIVNKTSLVVVDTKLAFNWTIHRL